MNNCQTCNKKTSNPKFCSRSCSAIFNNKKYPKRSPQLKPCNLCGQPCTNNRNKYCSKKCVIQHQRMLKDQIIHDHGFGDGHYHNRTIRQYLIRNNGNYCMICGLNADDWNGKSITLIVDHIDGKSDNNHLDNLRIVCPNCDSQLDTYKAKNKGNSTRSYFIIQK